MEGSFMVCTLRRIYSRLSNQEKWDEQGMGHVWEEERYMQGFVGANLKKETPWKS
jgi:hypothetical protein